MQSIKHISDDLRSPNRIDRLQAIKDLGYSGNPDALRLLKWAYQNDPDDDLRQVAYRAGVYLNNQLNSTNNSSGNSAKTTEKKRQKPRRIRRVDNMTNHDRTIAIIAGGLPLIFLFSFFWVVFPWIDLSNVPLASGNTLGSESRAAQQAVAHLMRESWISNTGAKITGGSIAPILAGNESPAEAMFESAGVYNMRVHGSMSIYPYRQPLSNPDGMSTINTILSIAALAWFAVGFTAIAAALASSPEIPRRYRLITIIASGVPRLVGFQILYLVILVCILPLFLFTVWFFFVSGDYIPEIVQNLGISTAPNYVPSRSLAFGYWTSLITITVALIASIIGFLDIRFGKASS